MQGKFSEAESMYGEDMKLWEDYHGKEHPSTLVCRYDVAAVLCHQEKDDEAEDMHRQILRLGKYIYGKSHPFVFDSLLALAHVLDPIIRSQFTART